MSLRKPSRSAVITNQVRSFGKMETLLYYADQGKAAGSRLSAALSDKNALTAAKESRELISAIEDIYSVIALDMNADAEKPTK